MFLKKKEPQPPETIILTEFLDYSRSLLETMSQRARDFAQPAFAQQLETAALEAKRLADEEAAR